MHRAQRAIVGAVILALTLAGPTMAGTTSGTTTETLDVAASISLTVPASIAYTQGKAINTTAVALTNVGTDNATGLFVDVVVSGTGPNPIPLAARDLDAVTGGPAGWSHNTTVPEIPGADNARLAWTSAPASGVTITFDSIVNASAFAPGSYTGSLVFTAGTF